MNKLKLYWSLQIGGWLLFAIVQILGYIFLGEQLLKSPQIIFWLLEAVTFLLITHLFRKFIINWGWLAFNMAKLIPRVLLAVFCLGLTVYFVRVLISFPLGMFNPQVWKINNVVGLTMVYALIFFLWSVLYFIYHYFERYNLSLQHEAAINEIELNNLKSQLNPHFIFNALNSIRALVDENPVKSKNAITQLSNILRNSLVSDKKRLTNFEDELKTVKDYLGLESIRFEERLSTRFEIHRESYKFLVPPLMLQTLVENGIKHGISKLKEGGIIDLRTFVTDSQLKIEIRNSGHFKSVNGAKAESKVGLGLRNTRQRLKLLYGEEAQLTVKNESKNIVLTELVIPKRN
ncbi:sensor histidine kinase [Fulvivirga marina]|uniref:sensor histidine kinase n=1 Tax=Fulvivirga marina TaxID=2494733 RepID=UPI00293D4586|nr:histidine kinase [Fulvivirga marina]